MKTWVLRWLVVTLCAGASLVLVGPAGASHKYCAWHGDDVGCAEIGNHEVTTCDREADGHMVRAWYTDNTHFEDHAGAWDRNGSLSGCDSVEFFQYVAVAVRACEEVVGCSNWVHHQ